MNESNFKKIWNYTISVGQILVTALIMGLAVAAVGFVVWMLQMIFRPSKD